MKYPQLFFPIGLLSFFLTFSSTEMFGQNELISLWTGLQSKQPENSMPKGNAPFQWPQRKAKQTVRSRLVAVQENEWIIAAGWEMASNTQVVESLQSIFDPLLNTSEWLNAAVPGTVLTTLVEQGVYPDPYFGLNNLAIPDTLCRMDWWYRNAFEFPPQAIGNRIRLIFNGINYCAEVFLNGKKLGNIEGAFIRGEFDVTSLLKKTEQNILAVHILPPRNPGIPHEQSRIAGQGLNGGQLSLDGPTFISSIGWDWVPGIRDRNIGLWQDVRLKTGGEVQIVDPQVITNIPLPDTSQVKISIHAWLKNNASHPVEGKLQAQIENIQVEIPYRLSAHEIRRVSLTPENQALLHFKNPRLWWPNGYGKQELYQLELKSFVGNICSDIQKVRFGIREMSYELMVHDPSMGQVRIAYSPVKSISNGQALFDYENRVFFTSDNQLPGLQKGIRPTDFQLLDPNDPVGPFLVIRVNGVRIFCRGGNWGMDDAMKRSSKERLEPYMKLHQEMQFNIVRNWTGESTEEVFYDLCDEYGLLVWNDFWITTDDTVEPNDQALFLRNAADVVRRFRNHPSIAIWCPRNEGFAPKGLSEQLTELLAKEDPTRHYHGQSRFLNMGTSGPWGFFEDLSLYYTQKAKGFDTEMGSFAIPTASTIRKFIAPEDQWPINDVWAYHDLHHTTQNFEGFMKAVNRYGEPKSMEDFATQSQWLTYDSWRSMLEAWNSRMWDNTTGLILWMSHPAWPSMIWQTYTYDYETPGSYFGAKKACEPLHVQMNLPENDIVVVNVGRYDYEQLQVSVSCFDWVGKELEKQIRLVDAPCNSVAPCFLSVNETNKPELFLVRLVLTDRKGRTLSINDYWKAANKAAYRQFDRMKNASLDIRQQRKGDRWLVEIQNRSNRIAPYIKLNAVDKTTRGILLPAYFSDGYFNLLPGEKRIIECMVDKELMDNCKIEIL
ncbi:MAG: glycoside hydrolase family 2 [Candidatus Azobacteroides sp.]|nr:glycoside hydrolase family 2 [Candidatus Azobacteroides sp.]